VDMALSRAQWRPLRVLTHLQPHRRTLRTWPPATRPNQLARPIYDTTGQTLTAPPRTALPAPNESHAGSSGHGPGAHLTTGAGPGAEASDFR
jgi:hypothetical protein